MKWSRTICQKEKKWHWNRNSSKQDMKLVCVCIFVIGVCLLVFGLYFCWGKTLSL